MLPEIIAKIEELAKSDHEIRRLWEEHLELDRAIEEMAARPYLTPAEEIELKQMRKRKLLGKDRLFESLRLAGAGK